MKDKALKDIEYSPIEEDLVPEFSGLNQKTLKVLSYIGVGIVGFIIHIIVTLIK